jgi:hypothetical protein
VRRRAVVLGLWSALCELGLVAALVLVFPVVSGAAAAGVGVGDVVGMGVGAGAAEALILGSSASRRLLWVGLVVPGQWYVIGVAVAFFALVDGVATYGGEAGWRWTEVAVAVRFHGFVAVVTAAECAIFYGYVAG